MTPERLKEIREILDQEIYITNHRVHFALKAADELYDEVSSRMPVSVEERPKEGQRVLLSTNGDNYVLCDYEDGEFTDRYGLELPINESSVWAAIPPVPKFFNSTATGGSPP
jgi:hypothetical protein